MIQYRTKFNKEINNNSIKLVYELSDVEAIDEVELPMVTSNSIKGLLETTYCSIDSKRYIKYNISSKISLNKYLKSNINKKKLLILLLSITNTLLNIEDYLIIENHIMYDIQNIYVDVSTLEVFMICLPIKQDLDIDIKLFIKDIIMNCKFEQTDNTEYVLSILNYLNSEEDFVLSKFIVLIEKLNNDNKLKDKHLVSDVILSDKATEKEINNKVVENDKKSSLINDECINISIDNFTDDDNFNNKKKCKNEKVIEQNKNIRKNIIKTFHDVKIEFNKLKFNFPKKEIKQYEINENDLSLERKNNEFEFAIPSINKKKITKKEQKNNKKEKLNGREKRCKKEKKNNSDSESSQNLFEKYENNKINLKENHDSKNCIRKIHSNNDDGNINYNLVNSNLIDDKNNSSIYNNNYIKNYDDTNTISSISMETVILSQKSNNSPNNKNNPYIIRKKTNEKIYINKNLFKIGKEKNYVDYEISDNNTISRTHADIIKDSDKYFIQDNNSKNHTYVNHSKIGQDKELLIHDCIITLSNEEFVFKMY